MVDLVSGPDYPPGEGLRVDWRAYFSSRLGARRGAQPCRDSESGGDQGATQASRFYRGGLRLFLTSRGFMRCQGSRQVASHAVTSKV